MPIILIEKKNPVDSIFASAKLFKKTWGETLISNVTLGLVFMLAHLVVLASFVGLLIYGAMVQNAVVLIIAIIGVIVWLILATLVDAALQSILKTLLYIYAAEDVVPNNFNRELLESMLVRKTVAPAPINLPKTEVRDSQFN